MLSIYIFSIPIFILIQRLIYSYQIFLIFCLQRLIYIILVIYIYNLYQYIIYQVLQVNSKFIFILEFKPLSQGSKYQSFIYQYCDPIRDLLAGCQGQPSARPWHLLIDPSGLQLFPPYRFKYKAYLPRCTVGSR